MDSERVPAVILCGGRSTRLGGGDKCLREVGGKSLLAWSIERLQLQSGCIAINANGDASRFESFDLPVIPDTIPDYAGPLAGILAAMDWAAEIGEPWVVTVAGDTPFFPNDLIERLANAQQDGDRQIAVACSGGRSHPVFAIWSVMLRDALRDHLGDPGAGRVSAFLKANAVIDVDFPSRDDRGEDPFFNINTPDDLAAASRLVQKMGR